MLTPTPRSPLSSFCCFHSWLQNPHRLSACHRHPNLPITGICASCLRDRLAGFHSSPSPDHISGEARSRSSLSDPSGHADERRGRNRSPKPESESSGSQTAEAEHSDGNNEEAVRVSDEETKTMKEFIDLELQKIKRKKNARNRDLRSFGDAAYALSEKLRKWKWNHKLKKKKNRSGNGNNEDGNGSVDEKRKKAIQSENGECGLGRRSCETGPRFSMDWLHRASWDGCLIGRACSCSCSCSCQCPCPCSTRLSPVEDANGDSIFVNDEESDNDNVGFDDIDGSNSNRRESMGEVVEESKPISNAKVSPTTTTKTELSLRDSNVKSNSIGSTSASGVSVGVRRKGFNKWGFVWNNKLGLVQGREDNKIGERESVVVNVGASEPVVSQKLMRSYGLSRRKPCGGMPGLVNRLGDTDKTRGSDEFMLQRNRSVVGYSISRF